MDLKNVLIFGDSYSTFEGYIPNGFAIYYSKTEGGETDVRAVEDTWWYPLIKRPIQSLYKTTAGPAPQYVIPDTTVATALKPLPLYAD